MDMKRMIAYMAAVLLSFTVFSGCSLLEELLSSPPAITLEDPADSDLTFDDGQDSRSVSILANFAWTASSDEEWCKVSPGSGTGNAVIVISVQANDTGLDRETEVLVGNETASVTVRVFQEADDQISVDEDSHVVKAEGGMVSFKVLSNIEYDIEMPDVEWIKEVSGQTGTSHTFSVSPNEGHDGRAAVIRVVAGKIERQVEVMQLQKDAIVVHGSEVNLSHEAGIFVLTVGSNVTYEVKTSADWISLSQTKAFEEKDLVFSYTANSLPMKRTATIALTDGSITQFVDVIQDYDAVEYVLSYTHDNSFVKLPSISGENISGNIFWGDGQQAVFGMTDTHQYASSGTWNVQLEFVGSSNGVEIEFQNIDGIQEIDLSGM